MTALIATVVHFIAVHSAWTFPLMFLTTFGESFVFLSLFFPGTAIMLAAGLLVSHGEVPLIPLLCGGIAGAVCGDAISWWLGTHYSHHLTSRWPFSRHPHLLERGVQLFHRFGTASVFVGRFMGPARATIPLVAGIMKMPGHKFWFANIVSALIWAPALLLPGYLAVRTAKAVHLDPRWEILAGVVAFAAIAGAAWLARKYRLFGLASELRNK